MEKSSSQDYLVSIITPTYNHSDYIGECIESVQAQTYKNWEMIIIDDGSTDDTFFKANVYAETDPRIRLFHQENVGIFRLVETYNKAFEISKGEFIAILEGDDYWEPNKLEKQITAMLKKPEAVMCWGKVAAKVGKNKEVHEVYPKNSLKKNLYFDNIPIGNILNSVLIDFPTPLTYIIRRFALSKLGGFSQVFPMPAVDLSTILALSRQGNFLYIDEILGTWRITINQITKVHTDKLLEGTKKIFLSHFKNLTEKEKEICNFNEKGIHYHFKKVYIISMTRSGRFKLMRKDYQGARNDYIRAIFSYGIIEALWKSRAIVGLFFSYLHWDVEMLAKKLGKGSLK